MNRYTLEGLMQEFSQNEQKQKTSYLQLYSFLNSIIEITIIEQAEGYVMFKYMDKKMVLLSNAEYDRMRIISPITDFTSLAPKIKDDLMVANFHSTLDARYAVTENTLYAAFMHRLSSLELEDFQSAIKQVYNLNKNFSTTYSSAQIEFTKKK
ncbi:MAG: hypothetical protein JXQ67_09585 [Campylobacterales bacterium]|nr:hypothetical protein [Campylobacterales bacterium]